MLATKVRLQRNIPEYRYFNMWQKWHVCREARLQIIVVTNKSRNLVSYYQVSNYKISNYRKIKTPTILVCVFDPISRRKIRKTTNFRIFGRGFDQGNVEFSQFRWLQPDLASHWPMGLQADHWRALISMILKEFRKCFDVLKEWIDRFLVEDSIEDCRHLKSRLKKSNLHIIESALVKTLVSFDFSILLTSKSHPMRWIFRFSWSFRHSDWSIFSIWWISTLQVYFWYFTHAKNKY